MQRLQVIYYETAQGRNPIVDFLERLDRKHRAKCIAQIDRLADGEFRAGSRYTDKVTTDIWELRATHGKEQYRFLYAMARGHVYILHAFHKKTEKIESRDIELAERHLRNLQDRGKVV